MSPKNAKENEPKVSDDDVRENAADRIAAQTKTNPRAHAGNPIDDPAASQVEKNIASIHRVRQSSDAGRRPSQVVIDHLAFLAGTPLALFIHVIGYLGWIGYAMFAKFSHTSTTGDFASVIGLAASVEAIFLALLVLVNQRRMNHLEKKNSDVHLQMSLLTEHEITRLARVTDLMARKLGVNPDEVADFREVKNDVHPEEILAKISDHESKEPTASTKGLDEIPPESSK